MRELRAILQAWHSVDDLDTPMAMATVVKTEGSTYRRAGARMLIRPNGERLGSISGGCLDSDVVERAARVIASGRPFVARYDTRPDADVWFEHGCNGTTTILIERLSRDTPVPYLDFIAQCFEERAIGAVATIFRSECSHPSPFTIGSRVMFSEESKIITDIDDFRFVKAIINEMQEVKQSGRVKTIFQSIDGSCMELLIEPILPPVSLLICGAGQDAIPLSQFAQGLGWTVEIADHRPALLTPERFAGVDRLHCIQMENIAEDFTKRLMPDSRTAVVIMTHNYLHDLTLLKYLLPSQAAYIGILGPRRRTDTLLADLSNERFSCSDHQMARLYSPAGLNIGSETPEEIAFAIVSEIQAAMSGRDGGSLRNYRGSIHTVQSIPNQ